VAGKDRQIGETPTLAATFPVFIYLTTWSRLAHGGARLSTGSEDDEEKLAGDAL